MTRLEDRMTLIEQITQARAGGARLALACMLAGIDPRTVQRWCKHDGLPRGDRRLDAVRPTPSHALSAEERARIIAVANEPRFAETPPARIVPELADEGYLHRQRVELPSRAARARANEPPWPGQAPPRPSRPPTTHIATAPGEVRCWDITFLPACVTGRWFYLCVTLDLYSRKIVDFEVHETDSADHAAHLARRTALAESVHAASAKSVLHGDNGATLKATTVLAMLHWLGIAPSYSRPRVSADNPFADARWRRGTCNWTSAATVTLNPEKETTIDALTTKPPLSSSAEAPAFPSRPDTIKAAARNVGQGRSGATRSHAQRPLRREHGEHRTLPHMSTAAPSKSVGRSSHHGQNAETKGRG